MPKGKLVCTRNGTYSKWYHSNGHSLTYIPKKKKAFAEQLAAKKYLSLSLENAILEKQGIDQYLQHHEQYTENINRLLAESSAYKELLSPYFKPFSETFSDWMNSPYEASQKYPEQLLHRTVSGHLVRSKSEAFIDMALSKHHIPFRYECALNLGEITIYPDFTILHPVTGELYYWEHFGMMDDVSYCKNACSKLQLYASHGIIPSIHLITTYESKDCPLSSDFVEKTIQTYFL